MSRTLVRAVVALILVTAACSGGNDADEEPAAGVGDRAAEAIDYEAIGLWDDGPCDEARPPLIVGTMTVFESPVLSLEEQATALDAAAAAFNARGGASGACIRVHNCDDGADPNQARECVREIDDAGVVATVNDVGSVAHREVAAAMAEAGIPRVASNVTPDDWSSANVYPMDASSTGSALLFPQALIEEGVTDMGLVRVALPATAALGGFLNDIYADDGVTIPFNVPVPEGTTDYSQFILGAERAGVEGVILALGEQEAVQVVRAGQQLDTDLLISAAPGSFSHSSMTEMGDFADQMVLLWSYPPATFDLPVFEALRDDLAASGDDALKPENLKSSPMKSWIGLYALLRMIRDAGMTEFTRDGIRAMLDAAVDVPMLDVFGGENWTPALNHAGVFKRAGMNHWAIYRWDREAESAAGDGNFVESAVISFDEVLCDSPLGAPC